MAKKKYDTSYTQNRELSWLRFNERVLEEGKADNVPVYERLKFVSIFTSNLDEFFMIRVGSLYDRLLVDKNDIDNKTNMTPVEQLKEIFKAVKPLFEEKDKTFLKLEEELRTYNIRNLSYKELTKSEKEYINTYFNDYILPVLSPQIVDSLHPFPHLSNLSLNLAVLIKSSTGISAGIVPIPPTVPRVIYLPDEEVRYVLIEDIILEYAEIIFNKSTILDKTIIRVTRNADISLDDEAYDVDVDYRRRMKKVLRKRKRLAPVRLELSCNIREELEEYLRDRLNIRKDQIFVEKSPLDMSYVSTILDKISLHTKRKITYDNFKPQNPLGIMKNQSIIKQLEQHDILLSYPYEKMDPFIKLLKESANDPDVISIKITIYRLARKAKIIECLEEAAENNKEVTVLMELRARFDEQNNIDWSETLEDAGCNVIYGFEGFKVHSKVCLITKKVGTEIKYISQIGTGNYNEKTACFYTDFSLMTANKAIGTDIAKFFNNMCMSNLDGEYDNLLVAPVNMKKRLIKLIDGEIEKGDKGKILLKMNSVTDRTLIDKLHEASDAGVHIKMIVRGICCLLPGIPGKTENITVHSIVGRFLEHSRVYCFGEGDDMKMYISSADFMTRNVNNRVEVGCPIFDKNIESLILKKLNVMLADNVKGRVLQSDGTYKKVKSKNGYQIDSQDYFMDQAIRNASKQFELEEKDALEKEKESSKKQDNIPMFSGIEQEFINRQRQELQAIIDEKNEIIETQKETRELIKKANEQIELLLSIQKQIAEMKNYNDNAIEAAITVEGLSDSKSLKIVDGSNDENKKKQVY